MSLMTVTIETEHEQQICLSTSIYIYLGVEKNVFS